jgi:hypothetical protein
MALSDAIGIQGQQLGLRGHGSLKVANAESTRHQPSCVEPLAQRMDSDSPMK